jgi:hypothetical protein
VQLHGERVQLVVSRFGFQSQRVAWREVPIIHAEHQLVEVEQYWSNAFANLVALFRRQVVRSHPGSIVRGERGGN